MNDAKHTPGPWTVNRNYPKGATVSNGEVINHSRYVESGSGTICTTSNKTDDVYLIAAAPDLLAALEGLLNSATSADYQAARDAIAKAKGQS